MKNNQTLYDDWMVDFRKILICFGIILLSAIPSLVESKALAIAILVQSASNIDSYWDFLKEKRICKPLKKMLIWLVVLSFAAGVVALLSLGSSQSYFEIEKFGCLIKALTLLAVSFPIVLLVTDSKIKQPNEEDENLTEYNQDGGDEDEL